MGGGGGVPHHSTYVMNNGTNSVGDDVPMAARKPAKAVPSSDTKRRVTASSQGGYAHWDRQTLNNEVVLSFDGCSFAIIDSAQRLGMGSAHAAAYHLENA